MIEKEDLSGSQSRNFKVLETLNSISTLSRRCGTCANAPVKDPIVGGWIPCVEGKIPVQVFWSCGRFIRQNEVAGTEQKT